MQKHSLIRFGTTLALAAATLCTAQLSVCAAQDAPEKISKKDKAQPGVVAASLKKMKFNVGKPNLNAEYYIYMQSASWCGPCKAKMPSAAKAYNEMKKDGRVEVILIGFDRDVPAMKSFLKDFKAKFPAILKGSKGLDLLPGYKQASGIPSITIVDADGNVLGSFLDFDNWKKSTIDR